MRLGATVAKLLDRLNLGQLILVGTALALVGQDILDKRTSPILSGICFSVAVVTYLLPAYHNEDQRETAREGDFPINGGVLQWAIILAIAGFFGLQENRFTSWGVAAWLGAIALCFVGLPSKAAFSRSNKSLDTAEAKGKWSWHLSWPGLALFGAIIIGVALRLYQLRELPMDLGWDLPYNYTSTKRIFEGQHLIFFPDNFGREGMFFYLIALVSRFSALTPYSIRITSALVGIATIPAMYLLARECTKGREAPAYATLLLAINRWHIVLSRSGYRVSLMPLMSILFLYGMARGLRRGRPRDWAWAGLFLGLGLWTYKAFVFAIPVAIGTIIIYALKWRIEKWGGHQNRPTSWSASPNTLSKSLAMMLVVAAIAALPMIRFFIDQPDVYLAREMQASKLVSQSMDRDQLDRWKLYTSNTLTSLLMFNYEGDSNSRFGVPFQRELGFVSATLLVLGLFKAIVRWQKGSNLLLLVAFLGLMAPMTISMLAGEKPNLFRSSGLIGLTLLLVSWVMCDIRKALTSLIKRTRLPSWQILIGEGESAKHKEIKFGLSLTLALALGPFLVAGGMLLTELRESQKIYFEDFREQAPDVGNYSVASKMAKTMIAFEEGPTFIKVWPHWYDGRAVSVHLDVAQRAWTAELFEINPQTYPLADFHGKLLIILHPQDHVSLETLRGYFPRNSALTERYPTGMPAFIAFYGQR